jgi:hypothetical protein
VRYAAMMILSLLLAAAAPQSAAPAPAPRFDPLLFFNGLSRGEGRLKVAMRARQLVNVRSSGERRGNTLVVEQRIEEEGKPARERTWEIREVSPGRYSGTLSDAAGPVTGETRGNRLHLSFKMKGGLKADQWLTLAPDGQSAHNILKVRKLGVVVATLDETIRRTGA